MADITVIGSNMIDLMTYIDRMPEEGETISAPSFSMGFGGKGSNQVLVLPWFRCCHDYGGRC